jgi:tellurite resistance protein
MNNIEEEMDFVNASGAVYAWMCASDGVVTLDESKGFANYLNKSFYVNDLTHEDFVIAYSKIAEIFETDFDEGHKRVLACIEPYKTNREGAVDLIKVARDALVVDEKLEKVEENIIKELCSMLDINEDDIKQ